MSDILKAYIILCSSISLPLLGYMCYMIWDGYLSYKYYEIKRKLGL
jgi:hypothetical protein